jgi:hypothetical protein
MSDFSSQIFVILVGIAVGIPILLGFRGSGRGKCWRCRVNRLHFSKRRRSYALLPLGRCEGCDVPCFALGPLYTKKKKE